MTEEKNEVNELKHASFRWYKPKGSEIQHTVPSEPVKALQIEDVEQVVQSALIHPFKSLENIEKLLERVISLDDELIKDNLIKRQQHDDVASIGATLNYSLMYHRHLYVYCYCNTSFTLAVSNGATQVIPANYWSLVNYPAGSSLTVSGGSDTAPLLCTFRSCDVPLQPAQQQVSVSGTPTISGNVGLNAGVNSIGTVGLNAGTNTIGNVTPIDLAYYTKLGQCYTSTLAPTATAAQTGGLSVFNSSTAKSALVYSCLLLNTGAAQATVMQLFKTTVNPALGTAATPINNNFGSGNTSLMTGSSATSGVAISGTFLTAGDANNANPIQLVPSGSYFLLPTGSATGIACQDAQGGVGGFTAISISWVEF